MSEVKSSIEERVAARVAVGADWLDERHPGWVDAIDIDTLDMASDCNCILGQQFGDYANAVDDYPGEGDDFLTTDETTALGFYAGGADSDTGRRDYPLLTAEWKRLILSRREAVTAS